VVIHYDRWWNAAKEDQATDRVHRIGQTRGVQVLKLVTEGTLEENLLGSLSAKHDLALAALDADSEIDALDLASGASELKHRLEVLLGRVPDAPVDESEQRRSVADAERLARRPRVALAAGELLGAAFGFVDELLPGAAVHGPESQRVAQAIRERLADCSERDTTAAGS
jgi:hypothetical protein